MAEVDRFAGFPSASWASPAGWARLHLGDCVEVMRSLPDSSIDAIVTDPPYGLEFMGKEWDKLTWNDETSHKGKEKDFGCNTTSHDYGMRICMGLNRMIGGAEAQAWHQKWAAEALRVLKPGGHLLAFGGTRTYHRMACAIEDAGFEIRDCLMWLYGSGFPKSLNVAQAIDKAARGSPQGGPDPKKRGKGEVPDRNVLMMGGANGGAVTGLTDEYGESKVEDERAKRWMGWGTALKPAWEPIVVARKPLDGTVADNVLKHGTGALNIDGCRVAGPKGNGTWGSSNAGCQDGRVFNASPEGEGFRSERRPEGRFPANVVLAHTPDCVLKGTRRVRGITGTSSGRMKGGSTATYGEFGGSPIASGRRRGTRTPRGWRSSRTGSAPPDAP